MRRNPNQSTLALVSLACIVLLAACTSGGPVLQYVTITPQSASAPVGSNFSFTAQAYYSNGSVQDGTSLVTWTSSNTTVATIVAGGVATALADGTTTINASAAGTSGASAALTVNTLKSIAVTPANPTVPLGTNQQFTATGTFDDATTGDITSQVNWTSSNADVTMDTTTTGQADVASTATVGETSTITAAVLGVTGSTLLTVGAAVPTSLQISVPASMIAVGNSAALVVTETWSNGTTGHAPSSRVTWASDATSVANIAANGVAAAFAAGKATITATEPALPRAPKAGTATLKVVPGKAHYAYVSNAGTSNIQSWNVNANASPYLTPTAQGSFGSGSVAQPLIDRSGLFMYSTDTAGNEHVIKIDPATGTLAESGGATPSVGAGGPYYAAVDPYGRFLFVANAATHAVYGFTLDANHNLAAIADASPFTTASPQSLFIDHTGSFLYVVNGASSDTANGAISMFNIDQSSGALTVPASNATIATGPKPSRGTLDPAGTHLYIANAGNNTVSEFAIASGGALSNTRTLTLPAAGVSNVAVDPAGKFAYVSAADAKGQILGFNIKSGDVIARGSGDTGGAIVIDPTGALMAVDGEGAGAISLYRVSSGALSAVTPVNAGTGPRYVTFYVAP